MHGLVDIGVNLTHDSFDDDREQVVADAAAAGVERMIVTGTSLSASAEALALAAAWPGTLYATAGVHPHHAKEFDDSTAAALRGLLDSAAVVAVGECGLDFFRDFSPRDRQQRAFEAQLELAIETGLPVFLHQRDAHAAFVETLRPVRNSLAGAVAHCFTGGPDELRDYLDLDLYLGVTGWVCDERRGAALRAALGEIPLDRLLVETDAPYLLPRDLKPAPRKHRNEPKYLPRIIARIAAETGHSVDALSAATTANAERLFGLGRSASPRR